MAQKQAVLQKQSSMTSTKRYDRHGTGGYKADDIPEEPPVRRITFLSLSATFFVFEEIKPIFEIGQATNRVQMKDIMHFVDR
jgi:hypothetical protein